MNDWCSQSEAAQRLSADGEAVSQQQISRYLQRYPEIPRREANNGQPMLVDFAALAAHRRQNIAVQEAKAAKNAGDGDEASELRLRERRANAEKAELELARARDELIPRASVLRAIQTAAVALEQTQRRTEFERAEALEATSDQRAKLGLIRSQDIAQREAFAHALTQAIGADPDEDGDEDQEQEIEDTAAPASPTPPAETSLS
jgi:hypothetical protein